jgi:hypothetical protein
MAPGPSVALLLLFCAAVAFSLAVADAAGTPDGSEEWGYVQVRPSKLSIASTLLVGSDLIRLLPHHTQRRTCSGGSTTARSAWTTAGRHGRPCSGCKEAR